MPVTDLRSLFEHELQEMYFMELKLTQELGDLADVTDQPEVREASTGHQSETEEQARRLEEVFKIAGFEALTAPNESFEGMVKEIQNFTDENPPPTIRDLFNVSCAEHIERYEISSYEGLIELARCIDLDKAADLLQQSLDEEEETLRKLKEISSQLLQEAGNVAHAESQDEEESE